MKMTKILSLVLALILATACFTACPKEEKYDFVVWVSESEGSVALAERQIAAFQEAQGTSFKIKVEGQTEADAGSKVVADVATAPDLYCFAQDQLARLVQAAALAAPGTSAQATIKEANDAGSVQAATNAGKIWAYPMTSDNGYYLYYNKSIVKNPDSLEAIIADCTESNKLFRFALENAWYTASFFFAVDEEGNPLCHSNWTMDNTGKFNAFDDNFNSENGFIAMKGMQKLAQAECYDSNADIFTDAAAIVTGIWNANAAAEHFGDDLGVTDLPSFEVDGKSYHLGSYAGYKLMGVKPQGDLERAKFLESLALYLTNTQCQLDRYGLLQWGPSNLVAQENADVKANESLLALQAQNEYSVVQGQIHGSWWDIGKKLGSEAKDVTDEELWEALQTYENSLKDLLNMTDAERLAWSVIGSFASSLWETDIPMEDKGNGVYESSPITFAAGEKYKVRQGASWDVNYGEGGVPGGPDIEVKEAGDYIIRLTINGDVVTVEHIKQ